MKTNERCSRRVPLCIAAPALSCVLAVAAGCNVARPAPSLQIGPVVADALADAHRKHRPLLVTTTSRWCEPCKQFLIDSAESSVLSRAVGVFETVTLDSVADEADCRALEIEIYPTFVMLSPGGDLLARWYGYGPPPEQVAQSLAQALLRAGKQYELAGKGQHAYCLYQWASQAGEPGPIDAAACKAAARLVQDGAVDPTARPIWEPSPQLAKRLDAR